MVPRSERSGPARRGGHGRATRDEHADRPGGPPPRERGGRGLAAHAERLRGTARPVVESLGYDLEDLSVAQAGRRSVLRVVVDSDEGVSLDAVADLSRAISAALDGAESDAGSFGAQAYTLEVSSPGVDRPLTEPRHWRRNVGRLVSVRVGETERTGRISAADPPDAEGQPGVALDISGTVDRFGYDELGPGKVQLEFARPDSGKSDDDLEPGKEEA
ncbi:MAG: ribosome maturation factor RimP [Actinocatenispora sp.]